MAKKLGEELKEGQVKDLAKRFDLGKLRWDLIPDDAMEKLAEVYTHGSVKYADENWRNGMQWKRVIGSLKRHTKAFTTGEDIDADSGCLHLGMVIWNAITLLWYQLEQIDGDNRIKTCKNPELMITCKEDIDKQVELFWSKFKEDLNKK